MSSQLLLVHSPLLGPSSWAAFAQRAGDHGIASGVPDLTGAATAQPPRWISYVDAAVDASTDLDGPVTVVGHSGAGPYLPEIGRRIGDRLGSLVFVDAGLPPHRGVHRTPPRLRRMLDEKTEDGLLPKWIDWWPPETMAELLPESLDRELLSSDMPRLPRSFYDEPIAVPEGWPEWPCGYLRLSGAYESDVELATKWGWPTGRIDATHLGIHTEPARVLNAVLKLVGAL